jgi:hypothetical protein
MTSTTRAPIRNDLSDLRKGLVTQGLTLQAYAQKRGYKATAVSKVISRYWESGRTPRGKLTKQILESLSPHGYFVEEMDTVAIGRFSFTLPYGVYRVVAEAVGDNATVRTTYSGKPFSLATNVTRNALKKKVTLKIAENAPEVTSLTSSSNGIIRIDGQNIGTKKGYSSFNGYITNSDSYIRYWGNDQIRVRRPGTAPTGCIGIWSLYGGWTDCIEQ